MSALVEGAPHGRNPGGAERNRRPALTIGERKSSVLGEPPKSGPSQTRRAPFSDGASWGKRSGNLYLCSRHDRLIQWRV